VGGGFSFALSGFICRTPMPLNTFQGSTRFITSQLLSCSATPSAAKAHTFLELSREKETFQYDRSKQAYVMHPNVHHKLEKYGDTFAEQ